MSRRTERTDDGCVLLTIDDAADRLRLSRSTLYLMIRRGELPVVRVGTVQRIPLDALRAWIASNSTLAYAPPTAVVRHERG